MLVPTPSDSRPALHEVRRGHFKTPDYITDPRAAADAKHLDEAEVSFSFVFTVVTRGPEKLVLKECMNEITTTTTKL